MTDNLLEKIIEYWDRQPCNSKHSSIDANSEEFFIEISKKRYTAEPHIPTFAQFHLYQGKRVLEIGCGIGTDGAEFAKHGAEYVGVDISPNSITIAEKRFQVLNLDGTFHTVDAAHDLSFLGHFDMVYSLGVLHHYPEPRKIVEQVHKVLLPDGEFKFLVYAKNSWKYAMIRKGLDQFEAQAGCPLAKVYTNEEVYDLVQGLFFIERIRQDHCFMFDVEMYKQSKYVLEPWFEAMPETVRDAVKEYLGWHLLVKARKK
jgi:SAM-dependent methyltransferase